jgi:hypothetical protein
MRCAGLRWAAALAVWPGATSIFVMAGLDPAIHVFLAWGYKDVDARHKAGHDVRCRMMLRHAHPLRIGILSVTAWIVLRRHYFSVPRYFRSSAARSRHQLNQPHLHPDQLQRQRRAARPATMA